MPSKPILDLLDCYHHRDSHKLEAFEELRRLVFQDLGSLSEDDLLTLENLPNAEYHTWNQSLAAPLDDTGVWLNASDIRDRARAELLRRDRLLRQAVSQPDPDVPRIVATVLPPQTSCPSTRRTRMWWLANQPLERCTLSSLAGLAALPATDLETQAVITQSRRELLRRGFRPPDRDDAAGEQFHFQGNQIRVSDRRIFLGPVEVPGRHLAGYRSRGCLVISWQDLLDRLVVLGAVPMILCAIALLVWRERRGRTTSSEMEAVMLGTNLVACIGLGFWLGIPLGLLVGYPVFFGLLVYWRASRQDGAPANPVLRRATRLQIQTIQGATHQIRVMDDSLTRIEEALDRLLRESALPRVEGDCESA